MATDIRNQINAALDALRGEDQWSEDERASLLFIIAALAVCSTDASVIAAASGLDLPLCELYCERAKEGQLFVGDHIVSNDYLGDQAAFSIMLDAQVLQGLLSRHPRLGADTTYSLTKSGKRYVEEKLLPGLAPPEVN